MRNLLFVALSCLVLSTSAVAVSPYDERDAALDAGDECNTAQIAYAGASSGASTTAIDLQLMIQIALGDCMEVPQSAYDALDNYDDWVNDDPGELTQAASAAAKQSSGATKYQEGLNLLYTWEQWPLGTRWLMTHEIIAIKNKFNSSKADFDNAKGNYNGLKAVADSHQQTMQDEVDSLFDDWLDYIANGGGCECYDCGQGE